MVKHLTEVKRGMEKVVEISMPKALYNKLKKLVENGEFASISEAVRAAVRNL